MAINYKYKLNENFIYFYHLKKLLIIPTFPDSVTDNIQATFAQDTPLSRSAPIYSYQNSGPRTMQFDFNLHRDLMTQINYGASTITLDKQMGEDYVDYMAKAIQAAALPSYEDATKMVNPPVIAVRVGSEVFIKGVVTGQVGVTYSLPIIGGIDSDGVENNSEAKFANVRIGFSVSEIDPYQASDVLKYGSYRGVSTTLEQFKWSDLSSQLVNGYFNPLTGEWKS